MLEDQLHTIYEFIEVCSLLKQVEKQKKLDVFVVVLLITAQKMKELEKNTYELSKSKSLPAGSERISTSLPE